MDLITNNYQWVGIPTVLKIISRWYNERGGDDPTGDLSDILVFAFYNDHQDYLWFMDRDLNHV